MSTFIIFAGNNLQDSENIIQSKSQGCVSHILTKMLIKTAYQFSFEFRQYFGFLSKGNS
jgi:hypothetical protein